MLLYYYVGVHHRYNNSKSQVVSEVSVEKPTATTTINLQYKLSSKAISMSVE